MLKIAPCHKVYQLFLIVVCIGNSVVELICGHIFGYKYLIKATNFEQTKG